MLDPFSGSATTGIAANLLGRRYLGLEIEEEFLSMSKNRRIELEQATIRNEYIERLVKLKCVLPPKKEMLAKESVPVYNVPWL